MPPARKMGRTRAIMRAPLRRPEEGGCREEEHLGRRGGRRGGGGLRAAEGGEEVLEIREGGGDVVLELVGFESAGLWFCSDGVEAKNRIAYIR
jgi:hypothetical protein